MVAVGAVTPERIEWFIEDQAIYAVVWFGSKPAPTPHLLSANRLSLNLYLCRRKRWAHILFLSSQTANPQILGLIQLSQIREFPRCASTHIAKRIVYGLLICHLRNLFADRPPLDPPVQLNGGKGGWRGRWRSRTSPPLRTALFSAVHAQIFNDDLSVYFPSQSSFLLVAYLRIQVYPLMNEDWFPSHFNTWASLLRNIVGYLCLISNWL